MSLFHAHRWAEVKRYFVAPVGLTEADRITVAMLREMTQGVTVVELRCTGCGEIESRRLPGDAT